MSYTTLKAVWPGEKVEDIEELRNSHGSAPVIWRTMAKAYLKRENYFFDNDDLWPLYKNLSIPIHHRAVLTITYDFAYIAKEHYKRAAADIRQFLQDFPQDPKYQNHWPRIAEILESDPDYPAIGFQMTSVGEELWESPWDDEKDEPCPLDWEKYWSVYDTIDNIEREAQEATKGPNS